MSAKEKIKIAKEKLKLGYSCSEALLLSYAEEFGLKESLAFKIASGFGGGMGLMGDACGAVTGSFMVIGLKYGAKETKDRYSRELTYEMVALFAEKFKKINSSIYCKDIIGEVSLKEIKEKGNVPKIVSDAIKILEEIFKENHK